MPKCELCGSTFSSEDKFLGDLLCPKSCRKMMEKAIVELVPMGFTPPQVIRMVVTEFLKQERMTREQVQKFLERLK